MTDVEEFPLSLIHIQAERARRSLLYFIGKSHPDYDPNWFHASVCRDLHQFYKDVIAGKCPRLMIFAPPQHGKSEIVSRHFPAWVHGKSPELRIVQTSYSASLAEKNCKDVQRIMDSEFYRETFHTRISEPGQRSGIRTASEHEIIGHRGSLRAVGVEGSLSGFPMDIGIMDDPFKDHQEAYSETKRDAVWNWWLTVFERRLSPIGGMIIINTRWHADDLCQRLLDSEPGQWKVKNYKAIATQDEKYRKKGEALTPHRYPLKVLQDFKNKQPVFFAALYQGTPVLPSGNLFKSSMFSFGPDPETCDYTFIMADTAYKEKQANDFNVFAKWKVKNNELYLSRILRGRFKSSVVEKMVVPFITDSAKWGFRGAWIEPKGHGIYLNQKLPELGVVMPSEDDVKAFFKDRTQDKTARANLAIPFLGHRKIHINEEIEEKEELVQECLKFPKGKHDDFVDVVIDSVKFVYGQSLSILDALG